MSQLYEEQDWGAPGRRVSLFSIPGAGSLYGQAARNAGLLDTVFEQLHLKHGDEWHLDGQVVSITLANGATISVSNDGWVSAWDGDEGDYLYCCGDPEQDARMVLIAVLAYEDGVTLRWRRGWTGNAGRWLVDA